jgi:hypothetical protein
MQAIKRFNPIAATILPFWLLTGPAGAADLASSCASNPPPLRVEVRHEGGPGLSAADRAYVTAGTNKFAFLMPPGYRLEASGPDKVTLFSADYNSQLIWRNLGHVLSGSSELDPAQCRELLSRRQPAVKILEEFSLGALGRLGPAFDLRWNATGGGPRRERIVFIPAHAGVMEFSLVSSLEKFEAARPEFDYLLVSFRASDANGKLVVPILSDRL